MVGNDLYRRVIAYDYGDEARCALMEKVWVMTPWMVDAWVGPHDAPRRRNMVEWCGKEFGEECWPIHGRSGQWQRGGASICGWTWFGFASEEQMSRFVDRWRDGEWIAAEINRTAYEQEKGWAMSDEAVKCHMPDTSMGGDMAERPRVTDGGPAYASAGMRGYQVGMSLRDWFAGQALNGLIAGHEAHYKGDPRDRDAIAEWCDEVDRRHATYCYRIADAMLRERESGGRGGAA